MARRVRETEGREERGGRKVRVSRRSKRRDAGTQRRKKRKRGQKAKERRGESGARRRTEDERRGNEKRKDRAAPDSAALIFNDILGRAGVPLMHGHYNMLLLPLSLLYLSFSLFLCSRYKVRVHACTPAARDSPGCFFHRRSPPYPPLFLSLFLFQRRSTEAS